MQAAKPLLPLLLEPEMLQEALDKVDFNKDALNTDNNQSILLVDLRKEDAFLTGHIQSAQLVLPSQTQAASPVPGFAPSDEQLTEMMQNIGLTHDHHVVVYDDEGGGWAGRFIWLLDEIGHTHYSYLNGGITAWEAAGFPVSTKYLKNTPSSLQVKNKHSHTVSLHEIMHSFDTHAFQVWDARSPKEYRGEKVNAAKGGHIPGALNYEWTNAMDLSRHLKLKPLETLQKELSDAGIDVNKDTITHCQSHHRSGLTYLIAKLLNFKSIKAYSGSWAEWGNHPETPCE